MLKRLILFLCIILSTQIQAQDSIAASPRNYCDDIQVSKDKFTGETTKYTPLLKSVGYTKVDRVIYLSLETTGSTLNIGEEGVIIILQNGVKISRPKQVIEVDYGDKYEYSAFIRLTASDIEKLIKSPITDFRLFIYDQRVDFETQKDCLEYIKCLAPTTVGSKTKATLKKKKKS